LKQAAITLALLLTCLAGFRSSVAAAELEPGAHVRVRFVRFFPDSAESSAFEPRSRLVGTYQSASPTAFTVVDTFEVPREIPREIVRQFEVKDGTRTLAKDGAIWGGAVGAVVGIAGFMVLNAAGGGEEGVGFAMATTFAGAGLGALIGSGSKVDRWREVTPPPPTGDAR
jgi:hypothetical protein